MDYQQFYLELFKPLEKAYGVLDEETLTSIVGFSAGGNVSLVLSKATNLYVTCELACYPEQQKSTENVNFEFFSKDTFSEDDCISFFTALGNLSFNATLGDGHVINVSSFFEKCERVQLKLFSKSQIGNDCFGLYEV